MTVYESDLPGVGKKFEIDIDGDEQLVVIIHNTGKREVYRRVGDEDSEKLFELPDRLARQVGSILEGAHFQPVRSEQVETLLAEGTLLEWFNVDEDSPLVGQTLQGANIGRRTGVSIIAIQRDDEVDASPGPDAEIQAGDTLVVVGSRDSCRAFEDLLTGEE